MTGLGTRTGGLRLAYKAALTAASCSVLLVLLDLASFHFLVGDAPGFSAFSARAIVAVGAPMLVASVICGVYAEWVVLYRARAMVVALEQIAAGRFDFRMPPAPDAELVVVQEAFASMASALATARAQLEIQDRRRRRFFGDLAHELAAPVHTLLAISEALARSDLTGSEDQRLWHLEMLDRECVRLERLVADVRCLAVLDSPDTQLDLRPADVAPIVADMVERTRRLFGEARPLALEAASAWALVDRPRLEQVLVNVLDNALCHTPPGTRVQVQVFAGPTSVRIVVEDSGPGVPDSLLSDLGDRLWRADPARRRAALGGHGLGLSIAAAAVRLHQGTLAFGRASIGGLRVEIELPRVAEGTPAVA